ncbi:MAG: hypothetical protein VR72_13105 [Clostridiaceae bacterium BRH_c20a]|nr:MAG: hypothetical protein VR72_13105 [Clostridiaceae bacterium BRH_c20a]
MIWALVAVFISTIIIGVPIAFTLGISGLVSLLAGDLGVTPLIFIPQRVFRAMDSFPMLAVPFFVLAGELMGISITNKLVDFAKSLVGRIRGGLSYVTVIACMFFGGVTGVGIGDATAIGSILIPAMKKEGYDGGFAASVVAASSVMGPIIPPSVPMIIFAMAVSGDISISSLFLGGIIPGIMLGLGFMVTCYIIAKKRKYAISEEPFSFVKAIKTFKSAVWALMMPIIIVGGMLSGMFTATEASVIAVIYALVVGFFITKDLKLAYLPRFFIRSGVVTSVVLFLLGMASVVSWIITVNQVPTMIVQFVSGLTTSPTIFMMIVAVLLLIIGCVIDPGPAIIMLAPILMPVAVALGVNPIHFAIVFIVAIEIGMITPPVGVLLFVSAGISEEKFETVIVNVIPFLISAVAVLILLIMFPQLVTYFPSLTGR